MSNLLAARLQMAVSLGFHIVFAVAGMAMPLMMAIAEWRWLRTREAAWRELARRWAQGTAILFAVGAVSGTVLSFELGLLWPSFMAFAGPIFGMPFALEGFAFFTEAIFLGVYLYGWDRVSPRMHWIAGVIVAISGALSGAFVVIANAWMNTPTGFRLVDSPPGPGPVAADIDPIAAMNNPAAPSEIVHMLLAAYAAVGFAVAAIHAYMLLRDRRNVFHRHALAVALAVGGGAAVLQPLSGDWIAKQVARTQPVKLAAMEGQFKSETGAPIRLGGIPDEEAGETRLALEIPYALSLLAYNDPHARVRGLEEFPREDWPPVLVVHVAFQVMVACGMLMAAVTVTGAWIAWRTRRVPDATWYLWLLIASGPAGIVAIEAGWTVTEVGRQPWIIHGVMRTAEAVSTMPGLVVPFVTICALYLFLGVTVIFLLRRHVFASPVLPLPDDAAGRP
jgi:cytochrome bd ubiquinol oxidase subunit I